MISQPTDPAIHKPQPLSPIQKLLIASAEILGILVILGLIFWQPIKNYATDTWHCLTTECNPTGPAASWQDQFTAADIAARKIDPDAILTEISVWPAAYKAKAWQPNDALEVTFLYVTVDGSLYVSLWDITPSNVDAYQASNVPLPSYYRETAERKANIDTALARIQISPRQAIDSTQATAKKMEQLQGKDLYPSVVLLLDFLDLPLIEPQKWIITYRTFQGNKIDYGNIDSLPRFTVETNTGAINNTTR